MADSFGLNDVSTKDTGRGKELKTGGKREYNMPKKSKSKRLIACMAKAKGNASKVRACKIKFATETDTQKGIGYKPKG